MAGLLLRLLTSSIEEEFVFFCVWGMWFDIIWDVVGYSVCFVIYPFATFLTYWGAGILFVVFLEDGMFGSNIPERFDNWKKKY